MRGLSRWSSRTAVVLLSVTPLLVVERANAGDGPAVGDQAEPRLFTLAYADPKQPAGSALPPAAMHESEEHEEFGYKEVSDFFQIREANPSVTPGEWELELSSGWETGGGGDDDVTGWASLKYGVWDGGFAEVEVLPINFGDGGDQGNGDIALILFQRLLCETGDWPPAVAVWGEMRLPTGQGSSGVDGELHLNLTKTIVDKFRAHVEGFVVSANGGRTPDDEDNEHFQWGAGPGFDYQFDDKTIGLINYLYHSREEDGGKGSNILELGMVRELAHGQHLKAGFDIGLDGREDTPNFGVNLQWSIEW